MESSRAPDHTRIAVDADVLAADLLVGETAREALDYVRSHSWLNVVVTDVLLDDAETVIAELTDAGLAAAWRRKADDWAIIVDQSEGDHPALAAAYNGEAAQLLTLDGRLQTAEAGVNLKDHMQVSVRSPDAFVSVFDPAGVYELVFEEAYPGPDTDPRV